MKSGPRRKQKETTTKQKIIVLIVDNKKRNMWRVMTTYILKGHIIQK